MKRILIFTTIFFLTTSLFSQNIQAGFIAGFNMSQVDGDEVYGFHKFGLNVGLCGIAPIKNKFSFSLETLYNQKGSYQRPQTIDSLNRSYKLKLYYLDVPFLLHYTDKDMITVGTGFSWGRLVDFGEWEHENKVAWPTKTGPYATSDVNWLFDLKFRIAKGFQLNARYAYSLISLRTRTFLTGQTRHQYNNVLTIRLEYILGDKYVKKEKKEKK